MTTPDAIQPIVQTKKTWAGDWVTQPDLEAVSARFSMSPDVSKAVFRFTSGTIARAGAATYITAKAAELAEQFIRIARRPTEKELADGLTDNVAVWVGIITSDSINPGGGAPDPTAGDLADQTINARGLAHILRRTPIDRSYVAGDGAGTVDQVLPFNLTDPRRGIQGNRSKSKDSGAGTYVFSDDGELWTAGDILEYLIKNFNPLGLDWGIIGATGNLDNIIISIRPAATIFGTINQIIDRRRGHGWLVELTGATAPQINVVSLFAENVTIGTKEYIGATNTTTLNGDVLTVENIQITRSSDARYDQIEVRGAALVQCGTSRMPTGWTPDQETKYKAAAKGSDGYSTKTDRAKGDINDYYRQDDIFADVYRLYVADTLPDTPSCADDGTVDWHASGSSPPLVGRSFLRLCPLQIGVDYSTSTPAPIAGADFLPPAVFANATVNEETRLYRLDAPIKEGGGGFHLKSLRGRLGYRITGGPGANHLLAKGDWSGNEPTNQTPFIDGLTAHFLFAVASSTHLKVIRNLPTYSPSITSPRKLLIHVPSAEAWYVYSGAIYGITTAGEAQDAIGGELRNDKETLQTIAGLAETWYSRDRRAVDITWQDMRYDKFPGDYITHVTYHEVNKESNSVISSVTWDFDNLTTSINSGWIELDFPKAAGIGANTGTSIRQPRLTAPGPTSGRAITHDGQSLDDLDAPVRTAASGGGGDQGKGFPAIVGAGSDQGGNKWTYPFDEAEKALAGYTGTGSPTWVAKTDGITGTAYNLAENNNTGVPAHIEGNGIDPAHLDPAATGSDTFAFGPIPEGAAVWVREFQVGATEDIEYWIVGVGFPSPVDGDCG